MLKNSLNYKIRKIDKNPNLQSTAFEFKTACISKFESGEFRNTDLLLVQQLNIICWEETVSTIGSQTLPPTFVYLIYVGDNVARIKSYLRIVGWKE